MPTYNYSSKGQNKLLKGPQFVGNLASFDNIIVNNVALDTISSILNGVTIDNSNIYNTTIGIGGARNAYFTSISTSDDVIFNGSDVNHYVTWDSTTNTFDIHGELRVDGCSYFDNIEICVNTISATNANGEINLIPNNTGVVNIIGGVNNTSTTGNFNVLMSNGNIYAAANDVSINSQADDVNITSFLTNNIKTLNGDINLTTETGRFLKSVNSIYLSSGKYTLVAPYNHNLLAGDTFVISNSETSLNGTYVVESVVNKNTFIFTSGNTSVINTTKGNFLKEISNNINLLAGKYVNIPQDIQLNIGRTSSNLVGNSSGDLNITGQRNITLNSDLTQINSTNTRFYDPILTLADYTLNDNDLKDRGVEFIFFNTAASSQQTMGWFGYKNDLNAFTFLTNITNNNEIITGQAGDFAIQNLSITGDISFFNAPTIDIKCGQFINVNTISGCSDVLNVSGKTTINMTSANINLDATSSVNILDNTKLNFGTGNNVYSSVSSFNISNTSGSLNLLSNIHNINNFTTLINTSNIYTSCGNFVISGNTSSSTLIQTQSCNIKDPIINIAYINNSIEDKGIEYNYDSIYSGWFGVKTSTNRFTYYSSATNSNNIMTGVLGDMEVGKIYANSGLDINGDLNLNCNNLINANVISSCNGSITITSSSILLAASQNINIPYNTLLSFGTTNGSIYADTTGNLNLNTLNTVFINGNLQVNGTTMNVYSTITNIQDPIISIGGVTGPLVNDAKDRGIEFKWATNAVTKTGFFGYQNATQRFVFIPDGINIYEVFYGSFGNVQFGDGYFNNLDVSSGDGNITGVTNIISNTSGSLTLNATTDIRFSNNVPIYYGDDNSVSTLLNTSGTFSINNTSGSILLSSNTINIPEASPIVFGTTSGQIYSSAGALYLTSPDNIYISSANINLSSNVNVGGNLNVNGNINYSVERYTLSSLLQNKDPSLSTAVTFVSVNGVSFNSYGTLGNTGVSDGQIKTILCSYMGDNCTYTVHVGTGHLIAPNAGNNTQASKLQFSRAGQSVQMIFDNVLSSWLILGRGCSVF